MVARRGSLTGVSQPRLKGVHGQAPPRDGGERRVAELGMIAFLWQRLDLIVR